LLYAVFQTELINPDAAAIDAPADENSAVGFCNASFSWDAPGPGKDINKRAFRLSVAGRLEFERGATTLIVGPTGAGKTSLLLALLGEMYCVPAEGAAEAWCNLPRRGGVAYAAQETWVLNDTIRVSRGAFSFFGWVRGTG
jgi:ABC-type multidrug transport system fused ATPase/permease subunit